MFLAAQEIIHPINREQTKRVFVIDGLERERYLHLAGRVMDVYATVTGKRYSEYDRRDYPTYIVGNLEKERVFELRFGMPVLHEPARTHGKLWGGARGRLGIGELTLRTVRFWTDTNDSDASTPMPEPSRSLHKAFDREIMVLSDNEFDDIAVPVPPTVGQYEIYRPDRT